MPRATGCVYAALALERDRARWRAGVARTSGRARAFLAAALAIDAGRFADAAETLREIGAPQLEAEARVLAARAAHEAERCAAPARQLEGRGRC